MQWRENSDGRATKLLYSQAGYSDRMRLERWPPQWAGESTYPHGAELFVLQGSFEDEEGPYRTHTWLRFPAQSRHRPRTREGCVLYVKEGGFAYLREQ
jgi:hypothetical protein